MDLDLSIVVKGIDAAISVLNTVDQLGDAGRAALEALKAKLIPPMMAGPDGTQENAYNSASPSVKRACDIAVEEVRAGS